MCIFIYVYKTIIIEERQNSEHECLGDIQEFGWVAGEIYYMKFSEKNGLYPCRELKFISYTSGISQR